MLLHSSMGRSDGPILILNIIYGMCIYLNTLPMGYLPTLINSYMQLTTRLVIENTQP